MIVSVVAKQCQESTKGKKKEDKKKGVNDTFEVAIGVPGSCRNYKEVSGGMLREDGDWKWVNVMSR